MPHDGRGSRAQHRDPSPRGTGTGTPTPPSGGDLSRLGTLLAAAARVREARHSVRVDDVLTRRRLARQLLDVGLAVGDVAALLGVSAARVLLLAGGGPATPPAPSPVPAPTGLRAPTNAPEHTPTDQPGGPEPVTASQSNRHEALVYRGSEDFLTKAMPFLREGIAADEPVLVAVPGPRVDLLREALGGDAARVHLVDLAELGQNPARLLPLWLDYLDEHGGRGPVRGLGEPLRPGLAPAGVAEFQLHEALLNVAVSPDTPAWLRCAYDASVLDDDALDAAECSHPLVVDEGEPRGSTRYGGLAYAEELFAAPLPEPAAESAVTRFRADDLAAVRAQVRDGAREAGLGQDRAGDLVLAVTELATNSVRHGGGEGQLRLWRESGALVVEVRDRGHVTDPLAGRRTPSLTEEGGRGLWLANQLSDLVQLRSGPAGTVVRVHALATRRVEG